MGKKGVEEVEMIMNCSKNPRKTEKFKYSSKYLIQKIEIPLTKKKPSESSFLDKSTRAQYAVSQNEVINYKLI